MWKFKAVKGEIYLGGSLVGFLGSVCLRLVKTYLKRNQPTVLHPAPRRQLLECRPGGQRAGPRNADVLILTMEEGNQESKIIAAKGSLK